MSVTRTLRIPGAQTIYKGTKCIFVICVLGFKSLFRFQRSKGKKKKKTILWLWTATNVAPCRSSEEIVLDSFI